MHNVRINNYFYCTIGLKTEFEYKNIQKLYKCKFVTAAQCYNFEVCHIHE